MKDILYDIAENKRKEIQALFPSDKYIKECLNDKDNLLPTYSMSESILKKQGGIIAEFKRRSPSKGDIYPMADIAHIIPQYQKNGAAAASVLTDTRFFGGSAADLALARKYSQEMPLLRKDFIVSEVQILESRILGASAILLIAAILSSRQIEEFNELALSLGMETLIEIHDPDEIEKISFIPVMLGINNRNLSSFHTDVNHSFNLVSLIQSSISADTILVAESGLKNPSDLTDLAKVGFRGFLIGEAFMSTPNPGLTLRRFIDGESC